VYPGGQTFYFDRTSVQKFDLQSAGRLSDEMLGWRLPENGQAY
jgi:hypothetical protein